MERGEEGPTVGGAMASSSGGAAGGSGGSSAGVPPGFRFHPTDEELLHYYLKKKVGFQKFDMEVIREVDLNKIEPWDLQEKCRIGSTPQNEWYFFSHKDKKYPTGSRTNRATNAGFWKATGRDKCIRNTFKKIGMRKTLVFYRGRAPHGQKTDWIMHEYRLEDGDDHDPAHGNCNSEDGWVICRVFKKKNLFKVGNEGGSGTSVGTNQYHNMSLTSNGSQTRTFTQYWDNQYLLRQQQTSDLYKSELALNYSHIPVLPYPHIQTQNLIETHKAMGYDYSTSLHSKSPTGMVKQLISNPRDCESGSENLHYQACEPELEGTTCEEASQNIGGAGSGGDNRSNLNEWGMIDTNAAAAASSMHHMNQLSLRGEMDFWGYGK